MYQPDIVRLSFTCATYYVLVIMEAPYVPSRVKRIYILIQWSDYLSIDALLDDSEVVV